MATNTRRTTRTTRSAATRRRALVPRPRTEDMLEPPPHPGEILSEEFLTPLALAQTSFARRMHIPLQRLNDIVRGRRGITPDTALRLARALGTSAELWLNLQEAWALWHAARSPAIRDIGAIEPLPRDGSGALRAAV